MRAALCLDDRNGLSFNHRRLSRDRAQQEDLLTLAGAAPLWVRPCSAALFSWAGDHVQIAEELPAAPGRPHLLGGPPSPGRARWRS